MVIDERRKYERYNNEQLVLHVARPSIRGILKLNPTAECLILLALPAPVLAAVGGSGWIDLTGHAIDLFAISIFALAYVAVMTEEVTQLRKSKPVLLAAGIIWAMIAWIYAQHDLLVLSRLPLATMFWNMPNSCYSC